jgi:hypothetical protein
MIDSKSVLYSAGNNDENYTPRYGVLPIIKYLSPAQTIWCPFDTEESQYVICLREYGFNVIRSHINDGRDYYVYEPLRWDVMVSNPPFGGKRRIFERALSFGKPFALLMSNTWLNDAAPKRLFESVDLQLLMFDRRIEFSGNRKITFSSSYFCRGVLPKQIIMERLDVPKKERGGDLHGKVSEGVLRVIGVCG